MTERTRRGREAERAKEEEQAKEEEEATTSATVGTGGRRGRARGRSASRERERQKAEVEEAVAEARLRGPSPTEIIRGLTIHGEGGSPDQEEVAGRYERRAAGAPGPGPPGGNGNGNGNGNGGQVPARAEGRRASRFGAPRRVEASSFDVVRSRENHNKVGTSGTQINLLANFFDVRRRDKWCLYHYHVDFTPEIDHVGLRKSLLKDHQNNLPAFIFDGASMHTSSVIPENMLELISKVKKDDSVVQVKLQLVGQLDETDGMYLQFYSIMARKCLQHLKLALLGKNYFDPNMSVELASHKLQIWPGFLTTIRTHDAGLLYCVQSLHKVIRTETIWTMMQNRKREAQDRGLGMDRVKELVKDEILGSIVITHYNKRTYRIDDISWNERPTSTFDMKGVPTTYVDYYREKHHITLSTVNQPLLVSNPTKRDLHRGQTEPVKLIPELCFMTGLSEAMRQNFNLMREMGQYLFQTPDKKVQTIQNFMRRVRGCPEVREEFSNWGLEIHDRMLQLPARKMPTEQVFFKDQRSDELKPFDVDPTKGDFTNAFRGGRLVSVVPLNVWVFIVPQRDAGGVDNLLRTMQTVSRPLGFNISQPTELVSLQSNSIDAYIRAINDAIRKYSDRLQMVFTVLPNNKLDLYSAIKKRCYVEYGLPSQCFLARNVTNKGLMSVATKLTVQMSCKLGGEAWHTKIPLQNLMIVGFDVHHGGVGSKSASFGAMVTTLSATYGTYFSTIMEAGSRQEVTASMAGELGKCVAAWRKHNGGQLPERIMFYRDGVGEGQLQSVYSEELVSVKKMLQTMYKAEGLLLPKFTYIVVTKRINPRFFTTSQNPQNPLPGTIVDNAVTFPERYDFYLIAQAVRQGTVSPTSYNVLFDRSALDADKIQRLTYKLCNMYYNFSGTVAVPAPCQYAHKLAFMTGTALKQGSNEKLSRQLYFL